MLVQMKAEFFNKTSVLMLVAGLLLSGAAAHSDSGIPVMGVNCGIKHPHQSSFAQLDSGFATSEDCKTVYVFPPKVAKHRMKLMSYLFQLIARYKGNKNECDTIQNERKKIQKQLDDSKLSLEEREHLLAELEHIGSSFDDRKNEVAIGHLELPWNDLIEAYRKENRGVHVADGGSPEFVRMPVLKGRVTIRPKTGESQVAKMVKLDVYNPKVRGEEPDLYEFNSGLSFSANFNQLGVCELMKGKKPIDFLEAEYSFEFQAQKGNSVDQSLKGQVVAI